jgi:cadmium resistance protein CadD (predicted permease)
MNWLLTLGITGVASFVATKLDDMILLMLFFLRVHRDFRSPQIIVGQYLGFTLILFLSSIGLLFGFFVSQQWLGLLGFVPLIIGLQQLFDRGGNEIQKVTIDLPLTESRSLFSRIPVPITWPQ